MDITDALAPNSDQLDAVELVAPRTFTIDTGGRLSKRDGKTVAEIRLVNFDRVWRPSKGMLDVLAKCWGTDAKQWVGRSVTLYNDTTVMFGKENTGGIRISHLSHIDGEQKVNIRASGAGRKKLWTVQPLADAPAPPADDLGSAKAALWSAWTANDSTASVEDLAADFAEQTGHVLDAATADQMRAYTQSLLTDGDL